MNELINVYGISDGSIPPAVQLVILGILSAIFFVSTCLAIVRMIKGPSILDRMIGSDVILAVMICTLGMYVAFTGRTDLLPVMLGIATFGFIGAVAVSRYVSRSELTPSRGAGSGPDGERNSGHLVEQPADPVDPEPADQVAVDTAASHQPVADSEPGGAEVSELTANEGRGES